MPQKYTVGWTDGDESGHTTLEAEDALAAAQHIKRDKPGIHINYSRRANKRGDARHPSPPLSEAAGE